MRWKIIGTVDAVAVIGIGVMFMFGGMGRIIDLFWWLRR